MYGRTPPKPKSTKSQKSTGQTLAQIVVIVVALIGLAGTLGVAIINSQTQLAQMQFQLTHEAEARTRNATSTVAPTFAPLAIATNTPNSNPTSGASVAATATPDYISRILWHKDYDELRHSDDGTVDWQTIGKSYRDFIAEATFINPYPATDHLWDFNFFFRMANGKLYRVGLTSEGKWGYGIEKPQWHDLGHGTVDSLAVKANESNKLRLLVYGAIGCLYVNDTFIGQLNLADLDQPGDIAVAVGSFDHSVVKNAITKYRDFTIERLDSLNSCP